jgi:DNA invertase Pin-like site-specific DNA recombinase
MNHPNIKNAVCAVLRRSSSGSQGTSIGNQGKTIDSAIAEHHLTIAYEEVLDGVSGSVPGNRTDIDRIIEQKRQHGRFKLLLVPDASRFTRAGASHGAKLLYDLRAAGLIVLFVAEDILVHDELSAMYISFLLHAAHETAKAISRNGTNGTTHSFLAGRSPYTRRPPMGMDRMYSLDGQDLHIIRNLPDGTQSMLHPITGEWIRSFAKNLKKGMPNHYIKQKNEKVRLVRSDPQSIATIHLIFHLCHVEKRSCCSIAKELNDRAIPSASGKEWHTSTVRKIVLNPAYVGRGIRYLTARGIYHVGGADSATPSGVDLEELAMRASVRTQMRPEEDWREQDMPELYDFLPEEVRPMVIAKIKTHLASIADGKPTRPNRDRHLKSEYLLKGILRSKQGGHKMTGKKSKSGRNYRVSRASNVPKSNNELRHFIPAEATERTVLEMMSLAFSDQGVIDKALRRAIQQHHRVAKQTPTNAATVQKLLERKRRQLTILADDIVGDERDDDPVMHKVAALRREIGELKNQLTMATSQPISDPSMGIERLAKDLRKFVLATTKNAAIAPDDVPHVRAILSVLVGKLEVDLATKELEIEFSLPSWVPQALQSRQVGLDELPASNPFIEAHPENRVILGAFRCDGQGRPLCYSCRRSRKAA